LQIGENIKEIMKNINRIRLSK